LGQLFGYDGFKEGQLEIIKQLLRGEVVPLGILPTGAGKSLTFQFPALLLSRYCRGLTVVVSPLVALMEDQVLALHEKFPQHKTKIDYLSGARTGAENRRVLAAVWDGTVDLVYLSPERLRHSTAQRLFRHRPPSLWVLDEAHTLSQWGHDFRPDFLRLAELIPGFYEGTGLRPLLGFVTATVTQAVKNDLTSKVVNRLASLLGRPMAVCPEDAGFSWRSEITTRVELQGDERARLMGAGELLSKKARDGVGIAYVQSRVKSEEYTHIFQRDFALQAEVFHAKIEPHDKQRIIRRFRDVDEGGLAAVVATTAFGMGIDREGIHTVVHLGPPRVPEAYLQEVGRAARRPGERGEAVLYWDEDDFRKLFFAEAKGQITKKQMRSCWDRLLKRLKLADPWVSALDLAEPLDEDNAERLATKVKVVLFYLEQAELIVEIGQQAFAATVRLKLLNPDATPADDDARRLLTFVRSLGLRTGPEVKLDVREVCLLLGMNSRSVFRALEQLVKAGALGWRHEVVLFIEKRAKQRLNEIDRSVKALLSFLGEAAGGSHEHGQELPTREVTQKMERIQRRANLFMALEGLKTSGLVERATCDNGFLQVTPCDGSDAVSSAWAKETAARWQLLFKELYEGLRALEEIADRATVKPGQTLKVALRAFEQHVARGVALTGSGSEILDALQGLRAITMGSGAVDYDTLYQIAPGKRQRWHDNVYRRLEEHYAARARRIHAMRVLLSEPQEVGRIAILRNYFTLDADEFDRGYLASPEAARSLALPEDRDRILEGLRPAQRRVVTDEESRALLVLAGPGSGKTHTIVRRVAYLVAVRGISPEKILVVAYNRTAAAELRHRIHDFLHARGIGVTVCTFHALAARLTGFRTADVPEAVRRQGKEQSYKWLFTKAIEELKSGHHPGYDYILVDEYQDVDDQQYELVWHLAGYGGEEEDHSQKSFVVAVGDDDQNLYEWRNARVEFIQRFSQEYGVDSERPVALTTNFRSRPNVVRFTNAFIEAAIPPERRLKGPAERMESAYNEPPGRVVRADYRHLYDAACWINTRVEELLAAGVSPRDIAVLAHEWDHLRFLQHVLWFGRPEGGKRQFQLYNTKDHRRPADSAIGRALTECLGQEPGRVVADGPGRLRELQTETGYSSKDAAWPSLLQGVDGKHNITQEEMLYLLEEGRPLRSTGVVLSTFHSAKGSEFRHVFVVEGGKKAWNPQSEDGKKATQGSARSLYVGFTRAKEELYVLAAEGRHSALAQVMKEQPALFQQTLTVPHVSPPPHIRYFWFPEMEHLFVSHPDVVSATGRRTLEEFARRWGSVALSHDRCRVLWGNRTAAVFSNAGKQKLSRHCNQRRTPLVQPHTLVRIERDEEWYERAGYGGDEDHHYILLPRFEVEEEL
jgi:ATP-dependent DNA helicase RecQ